MKKSLSIIFLILICLLPSIVYAKTITLEWEYTYTDESPVEGVYYNENEHGYEVEVTGFYLYVKAKNGEYGSRIATIPAGTHTTTYECSGPLIFVVTAYNDNAESENSNEARSERHSIINVAISN